MSASSEAVAKLENDRLRNGRSKITNGGQLFMQDGIDGRSSASRRFRDIVDALFAHLGDGGGDTISETRKHLVRRAAALCVWAEAAEGRLVVDDASFDVGLYSLAANSLRRILGDIGLDAIPRDVTPGGLSRYLGVDTDAEPAPRRRRAPVIDQEP